MSQFVLKFTFTGSGPKRNVEIKTKKVWQIVQYKLYLDWFSSKRWKLSFLFRHFDDQNVLHIVDRWKYQNRLPNKLDIFAKNDSHCASIAAHKNEFRRFLIKPPSMSSFPESFFKFFQTVFATKDFSWKISKKIPNVMILKKSKLKLSIFLSFLEAIFSYDDTFANFVSLAVLIFKSIHWLGREP